MQRHMDRLDRDYSRDMNRWQTQTDRHQRRINQIQRDIASNEVQLAREMDRYQRTLHDNDRRDAHDDARLRRQAIQDEIRHDREVYRRQQIEQRALNAEAAIERRERQEAVRAQTMPIQEYNALIRQRRTFHDAISRGHYDEAQRIIPEANVERSIEEFNAIGRSMQGMRTATERRERWNRYREQPPPMVGAD